MKQYENFSEEDFANDPPFQDWVFHPDEENGKFWEGFLAAHPAKAEATAKARDLLRRLSFREEWPSEEKVESALRQTLLLINQNGGGGKVIFFRPFYKWLSVAAVLLLMIGGGYFLLRSKEQNAVAKSSGKNSIRQNEIEPGHDKAVLTLADGRTIVLDTGRNGALSNQGGTVVIKLDNKLSYRDNQQAQSTGVVYNTVTTPRGGQYQLLLADGTKVWLNAASSLRFPTAFAGAERKVELTGEGYFEVAHDGSRPFYVTVNDMQVKVVGTHFNINAYTDEASAKTTLLQGRVLVKNGGKSVFLNPGQQAQASGTETLRIQNGVDVDEAVAWKNGRFQFNSADIKTVMRQITRWYDVDVRFAGNLQAAHITGEVPRTLNLLQVIKVLEASGIDVKIDGRTLSVTPKP